MCKAPVSLKDRTQVACRHCSLCRDNRLNDLIGRCIAEQSTASKTFAVTLTYAGDTAASAVLRYRDVQLFLKRLRKDGYSVRYICAGEYGSKKERAHWHIILFFYGRSPDVDLDRRVSFKFWEHGFSYFQNPDYKGFRYVLKYALKTEHSVKALSMSKKPPLGAFFFHQLAHDLVDRALPIHSPEYSFAHVLDKDGVPRRYWLQGRMRELFLQEYCRYWHEVYSKEPPQTDYLVERYLDPIAKKEMALDDCHLERQKAEREALYHARRRDEAIRQAEQRQPVGYLVLRGSQSGIVTAYSDDTAELIFDKDDQPWQVGVSSVSVAEQLRRSGLHKSSVQPVLLYLEKCWRGYRASVERLKRPPAL